MAQLSIRHRGQLTKSAIERELAARNLSNSEKTLRLFHYIKSSKIRTMFASKDQLSLNTARGAGTTFGPNDTDDSSKATPATSVGSATAAGHGQHPQDMGDDSNAMLPGSKVGP